jgi:uncharacterized protein YbjT (DUF2867 family)
MILLTGATGYVGSRLLKVLEGQNRKIRCMVRHPEYLKMHVGAQTEVVAGDVFNKQSLLEALQGVDVAYYLIHSMGSKHDFEKLDREGAKNFAEAAREVGVKRIIYLGGLGDSSDKLSSHLHSRQEVGEVLCSCGAQVIELRASIVLGSGSLSFEMIRALVERLPVMITPRWVSVVAQPIAISDLLKYLVAACDVKIENSRIFEIGGTDQLTYGDLMEEYARQRNLKRLTIPVPFLTPKLSSLWLGLVTPLYARVGRKLIDSIRHPTIVQDDSACQVFDIKPKSVKEAIAEALRNEDKKFAQSRWSDSLSSAGSEKKWGGKRFGNRLIDRREIMVDHSPEDIFKVIQSIGGDTGWFYANWLWRLRGFIDLLFGGVGIRRGRRHPTQLAVGDAVDWWRVEAIEPDRLLNFKAEMKLPGRAWLEFKITPEGEKSMLSQAAIFDPAGLMGLIYWYSVYPLNGLVFNGMLKNIAKTIQQNGRKD